MGNGGENKGKLTNAQMTDSERKKLKQLNKAKANPAKAAENKASADAKRARRLEEGSSKSFS
jgi:hypothetical protein